MSAEGVEGGAGASGPWAAPDAVPDGSGRAAAVTTVAPGPAAGVAVARGDDPWPDDAHTGGLGDANPFGDLRPVGVGGVLDGGFDLLRVGFVPIVGLAAALLLPLQLADLLVQLRQGVLEADALTEDLFFDGFFGLAGGDPGAATWVVTALRVLVLSLLGLTAGVMVRDLLEDRVRPAGRVVREALGRWWVAVAVALLASPLKVAGACLVYVGFFFVDALFMCASVAAGDERLGPWRALGRSRRLATANYATAIGVSVGAFVILVLLQGALLAGPTLLVGLFDPPAGVLVAVQQVSALSLLVTQPLTACIAARAWVELRCRGEALDLVRRRSAGGLL